MCDDTGQRFTASILKPVSAFRPGEFRLAPSGPADSKLPLQFIERAKSFWSQDRTLRTLQGARKYLQKT
jgi:hypothetical protein